MTAVVQSVMFGFGHRARSGKDTVAAMIKEARGNEYDIRIFSFGAELKQEVNEAAENSGGMLNLFSEGLRMEGAGFLQENGNILALPEWVQYDPEPPKDDPLCPYGKQRLLLQWWGTEFRRSINENYWTNKLSARIAEEKPEIALITDVRFPNEVHFVRKYGEVIKVDRPSLPSLKGAAGVHASELALASYDGWDDIIVNDGTLETLRERALFSFDMLMTTHPLQRPTSIA